MNDVVHPELRSLYGDPRAVDRRTFIVTSLSAGFAAAVLPVSAQTITTPADICVFDPQEAWTVNRTSLLSQGKNTPFAGLELLGRTRWTLVGGEVVHGS